MSLRILVVDDNRDVVSITMEMLRAEGYDAQPCYAAVDVLQRMREYTPDVVLLDIALPSMSGWDVAREIRRVMPKSPVVLIGISGEYTKGADRVLSEMVGFNYYLLKPFDKRVLLTLLEKVKRPGRVG